MAGQPLLVLSQVTRRFGGVVAVDGVSATVARGEIRALIGPNGSGKTTLLNLVSGLYPLDQGEIVLGGERIDRLPCHAIAARGVGRTFQVPKVFRSLTVRENLLAAGFADHRREPRAAVLARADEALALTGLAPHADTPASRLSGGQAMLLQLARALMHEPLRLLLLDEPFAGVHPALKERIIEVIRRMNETGNVTALVVSHEMPTVRALCHRVTVMHEGRLLAEGPLETVARDPRVVEAYLGRASVA